MEKEPDKKETKNINKTEESTDSEEKEPVQNNSFWKKLGSAVKKAVDCCLEG